MTGSVNKVSRLCLVSGLVDIFQDINHNTIVDFLFKIFYCSEACLECNVHTGIYKGTDTRYTGQPRVSNLSFYIVPLNRPLANSVYWSQCPSVCLSVCAIAKHPLPEVVETSGQIASS